jgi:hypothetical protein
MAYRVFITSASKDIDLVQDLAERLENVGVEVHSSIFEAASAPRKTNQNRSTQKAF